MPPLFPATLGLYAVACTLFLVHVMNGGPRQDGVVRGARLVLVIAFLSHTVDIGWQCVHGMDPMVNAREALSFSSWLICGVYLLASIGNKIPVVGALVVPSTMVLDVAARLTPSSEAHHQNSLLGALHIILASGGVALFTVAAGGAIAYLWAERRLKEHRPSGPLKRGPSLQLLDGLNRRCVLIGFPVFTVAMVTGAIWSMRLPASELFTSQYALATLAWLLFAILVLARLLAGWRGRRAALITLAGFSTAMAALIIYFLRGVRGA